MSGLNADALRIPVTGVESAGEFYAQVLGAEVVAGAGATVDLHGAGTIELQSDTPPADRFGRIVVTYVLDQPSEVKALMDAAAAQGAHVLKPAKKALFGSFAGSFAGPDGLVWKLTSAKGKDTAVPAAEPRPTEVSLILGVREPKTSRAFYTGLGMDTDRDYGNKYIDFRAAPGTARVCLMQSPVLAKDVGTADSAEVGGIALIHRARSSDDVERLSASAVGAGGRLVPANSSEDRTVVDPDGFSWIITASSTATAR